MTDTTLSFVSITLSSDQASQFLQGQITADVAKLTDSYQLTSICNLKGRVNFGFWLAKVSDTEFDIVISADCADDVIAHIKKYGAFSKITLSEPLTINPVIVDDSATFSRTENESDITQWFQKSIETGQWIITQDNREKFQPQELRLHQIGSVGGVHYDKGCYLGQEVIARLWFKAQPKAWLHRVGGNDIDLLLGDDVSRNIKPVNWVETADGFEALVIAMPKALAESKLQVLQLPENMSASVNR